MPLKIVWAYVTYLLFGVVYDFVLIPSRALMPTMTTDTQQRNVLSSLGAIMGISASIVTNIASPYIVKAFATPEAGWRFVSVLWGVLTVALVGWLVATVRERVQPQAEQGYSLRNVYSLILRNKPLLILLAGFIFNSLAIALLLPTSVLFFKYNCGKPDLYQMTSMVTILFMVAATALFPTIAKRLGRRRTYIMFGLIGLAANIGLFFTPVNSVPLILAWSTVLAIGLGPPGALSQAMVADTTDYAEWKDGVRAEGVIYSSLSLGTKLVSGLANASVGYVLAFTGYVPNAAEQTQQALLGITSLKHFGVGLCAVLSAVVIAFYPLTEEKFAEIREELAARRRGEIG
jgi:probable glucitol transport protein GutA